MYWIAFYAEIGSKSHNLGLILIARVLTCNNTNWNQRLVCSIIVVVEVGSNICSLKINAVGCIHYSAVNAYLVLAINSQHVTPLLVLLHLVEANETAVVIAVGRCQSISWLYCYLIVVPTLVRWGWGWEWNNSTCSLIIIEFLIYGTTPVRG